jgi:hypothetical protein
MLDREWFVKNMKKYPEMWGKQSYVNRDFCITSGSVSILNDNTAYKKSFPFRGLINKQEQITYALSQIKHLKGYYVQIQHKN